MPVLKFNKPKMISLYKNTTKRGINILNGICMLFILTVFFSACQKDKVPAPSYQDAVYFYVPKTGIIDTTSAFRGNFSFFFIPDTTVKSDTFWLPTVRIAGKAVNQSRAFNMALVDSATTAVAGKHYQLMNYAVAADSFTMRPGVILYRTNDLLDSTVKLTLQLQPSTEFPGAMASNTLATDGTFFFGTTYTLYFSNKPIEPPYWSEVSILFGNWSRVKYEFIVQATGKHFGLAPLTAEESSQLYNDYYKAKDALIAYNASRPYEEALTDEDGNLVYY